MTFGRPGRLHAQDKAALAPPQTVDLESRIDSEPTMKSKDSADPACHDHHHHHQDTSDLDAKVGSNTGRSTPIACVDKPTQPLPDHTSGADEEASHSGQDAAPSPASRGDDPDEDDEDIEDNLEEAIRLQQQFEDNLQGYLQLFPELLMLKPHGHQEVGNEQEHTPRPREANVESNTSDGPIHPLPSPLFPNAVSSKPLCNDSSPLHECNESHLDAQLSSFRLPRPVVNPHAIKMARNSLDLLPHKHRSLDDAVDGGESDLPEYLQHHHPMAQKAEVPPAVPPLPGAYRRQNQRSIFHRPTVNNNKLAQNRHSHLRADYQKDAPLSIHTDGRLDPPSNGGKPNSDSNVAEAISQLVNKFPQPPLEYSATVDRYALLPNRLADTLERRSKASSPSSSPIPHIYPPSSSNLSLQLSLPSASSISNFSLTSSTAFGAMFHPVELPPIVSPPNSPPLSATSAHDTTSAMSGTSIDHWLGLQTSIGFPLPQAREELSLVPMMMGNVLAKQQQQRDSNGNITLKREMKRLSMAVNEWKRGWFNGSPDNDEGSETEASHAGGGPVASGQAAALRRQLSVRSNGASEAMLNAILLHYTLSVNRLREPSLDMQRATLRKVKSAEIRPSPLGSQANEPTPDPFAEHTRRHLSTPPTSPRPLGTVSTEDLDPYSYGHSNSGQYLSQHYGPDETHNKVEALTKYSDMIKRLSRPSLDSQRAVLRVSTSKTFNPSPPHSPPSSNSASSAPGRTYGKIRDTSSSASSVDRDDRFVLKFFKRSSRKNGSSQWSLHGKSKRGGIGPGYPMQAHLVPLDAASPIVPPVATPARPTDNSEFDPPTESTISGLRRTVTSTVIAPKVARLSEESNTTLLAQLNLGMGTGKLMVVNEGRSESGVSSAMSTPESEDLPVQATPSEASLDRESKAVDGSDVVPPALFPAEQGSLSSSSVDSMSNERDEIQLVSVRAPIPAMDAPDAYLEHTSNRPATASSTVTSEADTDGPGTEIVELVKRFSSSGTALDSVNQQMFEKAGVCDELEREWDLSEAVNESLDVVRVVEDPRDEDGELGANFSPGSATTRSLDEAFETVHNRDETSMRECNVQSSSDTMMMTIEADNAEFSKREHELSLMTGSSLESKSDATIACAEVIVLDKKTVREQDDAGTTSIPESEAYDQDDNTSSGVLYHVRSEPVLRRRSDTFGTLGAPPLPVSAVEPPRAEPLPPPPPFLVEHQGVPILKPRRSHDVVSSRSSSYGQSRGNGSSSGQSLELPRPPNRNWLLDHRRATLGIDSHTFASLTETQSILPKRTDRSDSLQRLMTVGLQAYQWQQRIPPRSHLQLPPRNVRPQPRHFDVAYTPVVSSPFLHTPTSTMLSTSSDPFHAPARSDSYPIATPSTGRDGITEERENKRLTAFRNMHAPSSRFSCDDARPRLRDLGISSPSCPMAPAKQPQPLNQPYAPRQTSTSTTSPLPSSSFTSLTPSHATRAIPPRQLTIKEEPRPTPGADKEGKMLRALKRVVKLGRSEEARTSTL
ncbi:hypothetical protein DFS34DRAFT_42093 [Phlyctochytrium arcticum]|nr:hypothetical protein DFS34DRAFT_42093 [Phlyctochytrium arcticum]